MYFMTLGDRSSQPADVLFDPPGSAAKLVEELNGSRVGRMTPGPIPTQIIFQALS